MGIVKFEFKKHYKTQRANQQTTLSHLRIKRLSRALSIVSRALIEPLNSQVTDYNPDTMTITKDGLGIEEVTAGKAALALTMEYVQEGVRVVAKIPKSPHVPRPKKDK